MPPAVWFDRMSLARLKKPERVKPGPKLDTLKIEGNSGRGEEVVCKEEARRGVAEVSDGPHKLTYQTPEHRADEAPASKWSLYALIVLSQVAFIILIVLLWRLLNRIA